MFYQAKARQWTPHQGFPELKAKILIFFFKITLTNLAKLELVALNIIDKNYLS
jgi:hypothetical protein